MYIQSTENKHIMMNICMVKMTGFLLLYQCHFYYKNTSTHNINVNNTAMVLYLITTHVVAYIHNHRLSPIVTFSNIQTLLRSHILELHKKQKYQIKINVCPLDWFKMANRNNCALKRTYSSKLDGGKIWDKGFWVDIGKIPRKVLAL